MAAIEGESIEDDSPTKNPEDSYQISCFSLCTSTKNKLIWSLKNRFSERAFLFRVYSLLLVLKYVGVFAFEFCCISFLLNACFYPNARIFFFGPLI